MSNVYAINIGKGGTGKTSLCTNLAGAITKDLNKKVLIIDTDSQGNASTSFGLNPHEMKETLYDVLVKGKDIRDVIVSVDEYLHILPSNSDSAFLEFDILPHIKEYPEPFKLLSDAIQLVKGDYDYIFIDSPPSIGLVAGNVLAASDKVIIPFVPELFSIQGLMRVIQAIQDFKERDNPNLEILAVVGMMIDSRTNLHSELLQQARRYCLENEIVMCETIIPRSIRFANSTAYNGLPAVWTDSSNPIVSAYFELMKELIEYGERK